jgi:hypothetical protein
VLIDVEQIREVNTYGEPRESLAIAVDDDKPNVNPNLCCHNVAFVSAESHTCNQGGYRYEKEKIGFRYLLSNIEVGIFSVFPGI